MNKRYSDVTSKKRWQLDENVIRIIFAPIHSMDKGYSCVTSKKRWQLDENVTRMLFAPNHSMDRCYSCVTVKRADNCTKTFIFICDKYEDLSVTPRMNELCRVWMSHVTRMNESCHAYE